MPNRLVLQETILLELIEQSRLGDRLERGQNTAWDMILPIVLTFLSFLSAWYVSTDSIETKSKVGKMLIAGFYSALLFPLTTHGYRWSKQQTIWLRVVSVGLSMLVFYTLAVIGYNLWEQQSGV
jgi:hypothetical protein